jgi:hypothetical protein
MWLAWERRRMCTGFWWENLKERDHLENQGIDRRMDLRETGLFGGGWCRVDPVGSG